MLILHLAPSVVTDVVDTTLQTQVQKMMGTGKGSVTLMYLTPQKLALVQDTCLE